MAITKFGEYARDLRIDRGENLKEMAKNLGVSSAFLSAVENGKKQVPKTKEREDEKIRMSLIQYIKNWKAQGKNRGCVFHTWTSDEKECNEILAWLEKQGEKLKWSDEDERFLNDVDFTLFQYKDMPKERYWKIIEWLKSIKQRMEE